MLPGAYDLICAVALLEAVAGSRVLLPHIFDLFKQADEASRRSEAGLALVRSLVELHGGGVSATSEGAGRGSEFTVRLPRDWPGHKPAACV
jgi:signal transduction histidine kinase